jgi:Alpha/beta hydrolase domain
VRRSRASLAAVSLSVMATVGVIAMVLSSSPNPALEAAQAAAPGSPLALGTPVTGTVQTPLPTVIGPIPTTHASYPFNATSHNFTPLDLRTVGYDESEYFVRGNANVYSWPSLNELIPTANGPYETRILVRRPSDPRRFSGNVVVEMLNPTSLFDVDIMWAADQRFFTDHGDIWVGVTVKPVSITALHKFDPTRYADLSMANPVSASATCSSPNGGGTPATENGLAWDIVSQVGAVLKSDAPDNPLRGLGVRAEYLTGYSQTGGYEVTYVNAVAPHFVLGDGGPIFDGYLIGAGYGFVEPINQCTPAPQPGSAQWVVHPPGNAPVIDVQTLSDAYALGGSSGVRPDGTGPGDNYRLYQVSGASHVWAEQVAYAPGPAEEVKAGFPSNYWFPYCAQDVNNFPLQYPLDAAFANLYRWVRAGIPAPSAPRIEVSSSGQIVNDGNGNALGGVRTPYVDVPTATYYGTTPGTGTCEYLWGHADPFARYYLNNLYASHSDYVAKVREDTDQLVSQRWLTRDDGRAIVNAAAESRVP